MSLASTKVWGARPDAWIRMAQFWLGTHRRARHAENNMLFEGIIIHWSYQPIIVLKKRTPNG
jgi:hypothetical protein